jgi:hypothetical protein
VVPFSFATMEHAACNVIYLDKRAREDTVRRASTASGFGPRSGDAAGVPDYFKQDAGSHVAEIQATLDSILSTFSASKSVALTFPGGDTEHP